MDLLYYEQSDLYIRHFHDEPAAYTIFGVREALFLTRIGIHFDLLDHMQSRWDPVLRVYRVGDTLMCPTLEDFGGVLMVARSNLIALMGVADSPPPPHVLSRFFALTPEEALSITHQGGLDLQRWHRFYLDRQDAMPLECRRRTVVAMLLAHFFLCPAYDQRASLRIPEIVMILEHSESGIAGMILAETINGLSRHAYEHIPEAPMSGSPLVLYLWLLDKLRVLPPPPFVRPLTAVMQIERLHAVQNAILSDIEDDHDILHVIPWYIQPAHVHEIGGQPVVYLFGLDRIWAYGTYHLFRQFGADAPISRNRAHISLEGVITTPLAELIAALWASIRTINIRAQLGLMQPVEAEEENPSDADSSDDEDADDDVEEIPEDFAEPDDFLGDLMGPHDLMDEDSDDLSSDPGSVDDGPPMDIDDLFWDHDALFNEEQELLEGSLGELTDVTYSEIHPSDSDEEEPEEDPAEQSDSD